MTRVIHTGDTHIGYRQYHSSVRRRDFLEAFEAVVSDAIESDVAAVVHAGDLFHDRRPDLPDLLGTLSALRRLDDAGIPFLAIVGNHESTRHGQWIDLFERLGLATRLDDAPTVVGDVAFYGLDHVPASRRDDLEYAFDPHQADHAALVAHGLFEPFAHADWDTETVLAESDVDFDALLLGDNHEPGQATVRDTWVTYPGSTERASASEREGRGYNLITFADDVDIRRRALETRPFVFVDVELRDGEGAPRVREQLRQHDLTDAVVIVEVTGSGEPVTPAAIEEAAVEDGALIARVTDRREIDDEADVDVSFADPDDAVRERLADLDPSPAAMDVDEAVRSETIADSAVRSTVTDRIEERLEDGDLTAATSSAAPPEGTEAAAGTTPEPATDAAADGPNAADASGDGHASVETDDQDSMETDDQASMETDDQASMETDDQASMETDDQASMEEFR
ncbi:DNA double-strand break repair protein Mre11 [Halopenitus persicus]|uniref:DNA double-strand break repair protein Mre11 n=1 Tax=Halopenitus persicus TaxID=1048396 RepID=A0A1H3IIZ5_9EURY|nr:DNA double-strand break repair protein Mre11 [Halopenitus persicus]QHS17129.1 exonuclease SbcCD subunit D [haloarchaeon 3A1-DGR]SDY27823.1 DNA repair exonuclease SbcCD nuclease subunit [Halopenitus persicus]